MKLAEDTSGANGTVGNLNYFTLTAHLQPAPVLAHRYSFEGAPRYLPSFGLVAPPTAPHSRRSIHRERQIESAGFQRLRGFPNGLCSGLTNVHPRSLGDLEWRGQTGSAFSILAAAAPVKTIKAPA